MSPITISDAHTLIWDKQPFPNQLPKFCHLFAKASIDTILANTDPQNATEMKLVKENLMD